MWAEGGWGIAPTHVFITLCDHHKTKGVGAICTGIFDKTLALGSRADPTRPGAIPLKGARRFYPLTNGPMPCTHDQELEPIQGQRAAQRAGTWPYGVHMTSYRGCTHSPRGLLYVFLNFCYRVGFLIKFWVQNWCFGDILAIIGRYWTLFEPRFWEEVGE
jgi:hypothetical protein